MVQQLFTTFTYRLQVMCNTPTCLENKIISSSNKIFRQNIGIASRILLFQDDQMLWFTAQRITFFIKDFFSKCDQIRRKLRRNP